MSSITVLKFGSSVLRSPEDLPRALQEVVREWRRGRHVVAVVSAFGNTTDELVRSAQALDAKPGSFQLAALLATGEARAAAHFGLACERAGVPSVVADPARLGLVAEGSDPQDHTPVALDEGFLRSLLEGAAVVVVPGFTGIDRAGRTVLFGRGGSDLSALFLAQRLRAECRLIKDVDGVFDGDPASVHHARRLASLDWSTLRRVGGVLVQPKAAEFAEQHQQTFKVGALASQAPTRVGPFELQAAAEPSTQRPLRVALCGLGTVGGGVARLLLDQPERYHIVGALVRDASRPRETELRSVPLFEDLGALLTEEVDVCVELTGDPARARAATERALDMGIHVISADKALLALHGRELRRRAERSASALVFSAAVGGVVPMLETIQRIAATSEVVHFAGVLNGTVQHVLEATCEGLELSTAVALAQTAGLAEADPSADLQGDDTRRKLRLLSRAAFGVDPETLGSVKLDDTIVERARAAEGELRLVARGQRHASGAVDLSVAWEEHPQDSFFGSLRGAANGLEVTDSEGQVTLVRGEGAGRWPTATAVLADLEEVRLASAAKVGGAS